jgi:1,4-dihydroxy-6-naphthoate synthase
MLLQLALRGRPKSVQMRFDRIIPTVAEGQVDAGLIIHESRFTYRDAGLIAIADLGEWWENMTLLPVPLGAILVRNDVGDEAARAIDAAIRKSIAFARANEAVVMPYVREHAFEMSEEVMRSHIALYVNEFSDDLGEIGIDAVRALFARARAAGILERETEPRFV